MTQIPRSACSRKCLGAALAALVLVTIYQIWTQLSSSHPMIYIEKIKVPRIRLVMTCCGAELAENTVVAVKSAIIFSQESAIEVFFFTDDTCRPGLSRKVGPSHKFFQKFFHIRNHNNNIYCMYYCTHQIAALKNTTLKSRFGEFSYQILPIVFPYGSEHWPVQPRWICTPNRLFLPVSILHYFRPFSIIYQTHNLFKHGFLAIYPSKSFRS